MIKFKIETNTYLNHLDMSSTVVENVEGHKRNPTTSSVFYAGNTSLDLLSEAE
jgi:hypothetical protein